MVDATPARRTARAPEYEIRRTGAADVEPLVEMFTAVVDEGRWLGAEPGFDRADRVAGLRASLADPTHANFVAVTPDGEIIGQGHIERHEYGVAELGMAVAAGWRRLGVGHALLVALADWARDHGVHKLSLQCWPHNHAALALYERFGFVREGLLDRHYRRRDGELWSAVVMGLVIDDAPASEPHGGQ